MICDLLCLDSLTLHNIFKIHPFCSTCQYFIPSSLNNKDGSYFVYPFICGPPFWLFLPFGYCKWCCCERSCLNTCLQLGIQLGVEFLGHVATFVCFLRTYQTVPRSSGTTPLLTHSNVQGFQFLHILTHTYFPYFKMHSHPSRCEEGSCCGFALYSRRIDDEQHFVCLLAFCVFFGEMSVQILCPLFD